MTDHKDTSGAVIAASGMVEIYQHTKDMKYLVWASDILQSVADLMVVDSSRTESVLKGCYHDCGDDGCSVIESEYYYLEALLRYDAVLKALATTRV